MVYTRNMDTKGDNFKVKWRLGIFIRYPQVQKAYRVYDIKDRKFVVSRAVRFVQNEFPFNS